MSGGKPESLEGIAKSKDLSDRANDFFAPHTILPSQFFDRFQRSRHVQSEKSLMYAVLEGALHEYQKFALEESDKGRRLFREAERWLNLIDREWPFSFVNLCDALELDASYLRRGLRKWLKEKLREQAAAQQASVRTAEV